MVGGIKWRAWARAGALAGFGLAALAAAPALGQSTGQQITVTANSQPAPDMLGTIPLQIRADRFASEWRRAREDASWSPELQRLVAPARSLPREQQLDYVQRSVHSLIRWRSDATEWGRHDYWASAAQTLQRGVGDMEDRAIVKMQALRALGFPARDLYLTMGRDRVGGPITVLMVRHRGRYVMLDDTGGKPIVLDHRSYEFQPQLTLGWNSAWVHGRRIAAGSRTAGASAPKRQTARALRAAQ